MKKIKLTEAVIQQILGKWLITKYDMPIIANNIYLHPNREYDQISISSFLKLTEYEIKISLSDYKADFEHKKLKHKIYASLYNKNKINKKFMEAVPNRFYYVAPEDMIKQIPVYAGLISIRISSDNSLSCILIRKAPLLHNNKISLDILLKIAKNYTKKSFK